VAALQATSRGDDPLLLGLAADHLIQDSATCLPAAGREGCYLRQAGRPLIRFQRVSCRVDEGGNQSLLVPLRTESSIRSTQSEPQDSDGLISSINTAKASLSWSEQQGNSF
jgi:hypothetical protein